MPALVIPKAMLAVARGTVLGRPWANVIGLSTGGGPLFLTSTIANQIGEAVRDLYEILAPNLSNQWSLQEVVIQDLQTETAPSYETAALPLVGAASTDPMPSNVCLVATHRTDKRGKSYRGRTYLGGWCEPSNGSNGQASSGAQANVVTAFSTFRASLAAIPAQPAIHAVVSRSLATVTPVVTTTCDGAWDHQDRRKP